MSDCYILYQMHEYASTDHEQNAFKRSGERGRERTNIQPACFDR